MKREEFCEVLGDINENYVKEAGANPKAEKRRQFKWKVIAACLCLLLAAPLTVFAMDTNQRGRENDGCGRKQPADGRNSEPAAR